MYSKPLAVGCVHALMQLLAVALVPTCVPPDVSEKLAGFLIPYILAPLKYIPSHQS